MYSSAKASTGPPPDAAKFLRIGIIAIIVVMAFLLVGNQGVVLLMNFEEFADLFTTPLYLSLVSSLILATIALVRVNIVKRHSILWYTLRTMIGFINRNTTATITESIPNFHDHKISVPHFVIWQITKVLLFGAFFANVFFGFAVMHIIDGNDIGIENISTIFSGYTIRIPLW